jgi:hypothetical protein
MLTYTVQYYGVLIGKRVNSHHPVMICLLRLAMPFLAKISFHYEPADNEKQFLKKHYLKFVLTVYIAFTDNYNILRNTKCVVMFSQKI